MWALSLISGKVASCDALFVPEGIEIRMLRDGTFIHGETFASPEEALAYAEEARGRLLMSGWVVKEVQ